MNRRDVVSGLLLGGIGVAAAEHTRAEQASAAIGHARGGPRIVIFDDRFAAARQFALKFGPGAWLTRGIAGDVTALWHELIEIKWHRHAVAVQGLTCAPAFFCLQQLVADQYWRPVAQAREGALLQWVLMPKGLAS